MRHIDRERAFEAIMEMYRGAKEKDWGEVDDFHEALGWDWDPPTEEEVILALRELIAP